MYSIYSSSQYKTSQFSLCLWDIFLLVNCTVFTGILKYFFHFINTFFLVCFVLKTIFYHLMNCVFIFTLLNISKFNFCFCFSFFNISIYFFLLSKRNLLLISFLVQLITFQKNIIFICKQYANNQQFGKLLCLECISMLLKMSKGDKNKTLQKKPYLYLL